MIFSSDFISLYKSIFLGRQDVHAVRWEEDGKTGYMPAYKVDWNDYNKYKSGGEIFKDYANKEYIPFSDRGSFTAQHSDNPPVIFDYRDSKIDYFEKMFKQRNRYYKKLSKQIQID